LFIDDRELTPTLSEIQQLTGLPIFGWFYDEFIVSPADLRDSSRFPPSLQRVYDIYYYLRGGNSGVPFRHWIAFFTDRVHTRPEGLASIRDPFGTSQPDIHPDIPLISQDTLCSHDIDREAYLTAFISWWICYFLLPSSPAYTIRPSVFVMASLIARGNRTSLAVPVLANIYRGIRGLVSSRSPSRCRELIPWHLVSGWLHMHWSGSYDPGMAASLRDHLPLLSDLARVQPTSLTPTDARYRFYRSRDHLRFARDRLTTRRIARTVERSVIDSRVPSSDPSSIRDRLTDLEYLVSIRQGFLPLRLGDHIFIEPYSPHRCAHQFGLDQDIPAPLLRPEFLAADLEGVGWCYTHLFRLGTGVHCQMVSTSRVPTFSRRYQQWYHDAIRSYQSYTPPIVARITCPRDGHVSSSGDISYGRSLFPDITVEPIDFQGLDSRFSRAPVRTTLTGIFHHPFRLFFLLVSLVHISIDSLFDFRVGL
jgi:Plant mobile domain